MITMRSVPALVLLSAGLLAGCGLGPGTTVTEDVPLTGDVRTVALDTGSGDVTVRHDPAVDAPRLVRRLEFRGDRPGVTTAQDGERLTLNGCPGPCSVDYDLVLPDPEATVNGTMSSGDADVSGVEAVDLELSSGRATLRDVAGPVSLALSSGDVEASGLGGDTTVRSSSGSVRIALARPASVQVRATSGDVAVAVPPGDYAVRTETGSGDDTSTVPSTPGAQYTVDVATNSGDVEVTPAG